MPENRQKQIETRKSLTHEHSKHTDTHRQNTHVHRHACTHTHTLQRDRISAGGRPLSILLMMQSDGQYIKWMFCGCTSSFFKSGLFRHEYVHAQSCPTLCELMDCCPPGSSVHGIFQARILEWFAISFSRGSSPTRNQTQVSRIAGRRFTFWTTREALNYANTAQSAKSSLCSAMWGYEEKSTIWD